MDKKTEALKLALELLAVATYYSPDLQQKRSEVIDAGLKALAEQPAQQLTDEKGRPLKFWGGKAEQPAQQHIEHCLWARNGHTPRPHVQPAQQQEPEPEDLSDFLTSVVKNRMDAWGQTTDAYVRGNGSEPISEELLLRGILASELKCWHRLTADEAQNLVAFVQNMPAKLREKNA